MTEPGPSVRPRFLAFLPGFLFRPERPLAYLAKAFPLILIPSLLLGALIYNLSAESGTGPQGPEIDIGGPQMILLLTVFAPFVETLIMILPLLGLNRLFGLGPAVVLSAIGWGLAHSLGAFIWGFVAWWPFLIFSIMLLTWRRRSLLLATGMVTALHALQNSLAVASILLGLARG
jgi:membrane protease YdiL (CAAX protease family)